MLPVKSGSITPAFTSNSYSMVRPDLDVISFRWHNSKVNKNSFLFFWLYLKVNRSERVVSH